MFSRLERFVAGIPSWPFALFKATTVLIRKDGVRDDFIGSIARRHALLNDGDADDVP